jgi:hypothetical protein
MKYMLKDLEDTIELYGLDNRSKFNLILYTDNSLMKNLSDYCEFLYPNIKVFTPDYGQFPEEVNLNLDTFIYGERDFTDFIQINEFDLLSKNDKRHNVTITWYKGHIAPQTFTEDGTKFMYKAFIFPYLLHFI